MLKLPYVMFLLLFIGASFASGAEQCPNPKPDYPSISFGMTGIWGNFCKNQLDRARWLGFTTVSMSPAFYFNDQDGTVTASDQPGQLEACLDYAKKLGFDIVYKPMIEAEPASVSTVKAAQSPMPPGPETLETSLLRTPDQSNAPWRAWFDFRPGADYESKVIVPFLNWLEKNQLRDKPFYASIVVATEMHRSLADYSPDWTSLVSRTQNRLRQDKLRNQVDVGLDPTVFGMDAWLPDEIKRPLSALDCTNYENLLWTTDFFSSSVYGDYLAAGFATNPAQSIQKMYETNETNWEAALKSRGCVTDPHLIARFKSADFQHRDKGRGVKVAWPGEIGYAGNLAQSWSGFETVPPYGKPADIWEQYRTVTLVKEQNEFVTEAELWVKGILDQARGSNLDTVSFWITGRFDVFGFSSLPPLGDLQSYDGEYTSKDPVKGADAIPAVAHIRDLLQAYTAERCPGWQPGPGVSP